MHPFSTLAPNVVLSAGSDDYIDGIATPLVPQYLKPMQLWKNYNKEALYSWSKFSCSA